MTLIEKTPDIAAPKKPEPTRLPASGDRDLDAEFKADTQRIADEAHAKNRLDQYAAEQGLENTNANFAILKEFVDKSAAKGYWSSQIVDVAVANLGPRGSNQLTWRKAEAPPSPAPETVEPQEVLITLKDGSQQLPLDATPSKHHTSEQLKDWLKRINEGKLIRPRGSFSSHLA